MRQGDSGMFTMRVHGAPDGSIAVEAEKADPDPVSNLVCRITGPGRAIDVPMTELAARSIAAKSGRSRAASMRDADVQAGETEKIPSSANSPLPARSRPTAPSCVSNRPISDLLRRLSTATHGAFEASPRLLPAQRSDRGISPQR